MMTACGCKEAPLAFFTRIPKFTPQRTVRPALPGPVDRKTCQTLNAKLTCPRRAAFRTQEAGGPLLPTLRNRWLTLGRVDISSSSEYYRSP